MWTVRAVWYMGEYANCDCPGCPEQVSMANACGICPTCLDDHDSHPMALPCATCGIFPHVWEMKSAWSELSSVGWFASCSCDSIHGATPQHAVINWNHSQHICSLVLAAQRSAMQRITR
jgi:hypothetical protein